MEAPCVLLCSTHCYLECVGDACQLVESVDKSSPAGTSLKRTLYGETANQFIGHAPRCRHSKENTEEFAVIGLGVRNCKTLQDSLKAFVQGEAMEGGNAYKCVKVRPTPRKETGVACES
jgi:hypothetical protein